MKPTTLTVISAAIVAAVVSLIIALVVAGATNKGHGTATAQVYPHIQSTGVIRAGYVVGAPLLIVDPNGGQKSGIFYDIMNGAARHLGMKVEWTEEVGYGQMIQGLNAGRYDVVGSGVWINADRGKAADFTNPVYYDAVYAYVRVTDRRIDPALSNLNSPNFTISTMDGELGASIAASDFPRARALALPQSADFSQLILNVVSGKADVVLLSAASAADYQAAHPGQIIAIDPAKPIRIFPNAILLPQGQYVFKQALDYALMEMVNDGEIDAILKKYEKASGSFLRVAPPYERTSSPR